MDYLANKAPRSHKAILISQGLNPETGDMATFVEHCRRAETMDNIVMAKFSASYEDSDTKRHKNCSKFKEREENGKKRRKKNFSLYCSLRGKNKIHTSRECKFLKASSKDKYNPKSRKNYYKKEFK